MRAVLLFVGNLSVSSIIIAKHSKPCQGSVFNLIFIIIVNLNAYTTTL